MLDKRFIYTLVIIFAVHIIIYILYIYLYIYSIAYSHIKAPPGRIYAIYTSSWCLMIFMRSVMKYPGQTSIYNHIHYHDDYTCMQFWQSHEKSTRKISIGPSGCKQYNILYIVWVLGLYGEYKTFTP